MLLRFRAQPLACSFLPSIICSPYFILQADLRVGLRAFFRVGELGGKTLARFDALIAFLEEDAPGARVPWKGLFEEDREFNQGAFAEALRDQFLEERLEKAAAREAALRRAADEDGLLDAAAVASAIALANPTASAADARAGAELALAGGEHVTPAVAARRLARGAAKQEALAASIGQPPNKAAGEDDAASRTASMGGC